MLVLLHLYVLVFGFSPLAAASCSRDVLLETMNSFLDSAYKHTEFPVSSSVKISENNDLFPSLASTALYNITGLWKPWRLDSIDEKACQIGSFVVSKKMDKSESSPGLFSIRIKIPNDSSAASEIEMLHNPPSGSGPVFRPKAIPDQAPTSWSSFTTSNSTEKMEREQLVAIANTYCEGVAAKNGSLVIAADECPRFENGFKTSQHCNKQFGVFGFPVQSRRWIADEVTGVVMGTYMFNYTEKFKFKRSLGSVLFLNEFFKVENGAITAIDANMRFLKGPYIDVWDST
jgi:hypothetical protein